MRNWSSYVTAARESANMSRKELAEAVGTVYATVWRWETGKQTPENGEVVARVAKVTGVDLNEALAAAGLRPGVDAPDRPARQDPPMDDDVRYLLRRLADPDVRAEEKRFIRATLQRAARIMQEQEALAAAEDELDRRRKAGEL